VASENINPVKLLGSNGSHSLTHCLTKVRMVGDVSVGRRMGCSLL
jgi:hypothetical protein